jgi:hypothetical protein
MGYHGNYHNRTNPPLIVTLPLQSKHNFGILWRHSRPCRDKGLIASLLPMRVKRGVALLYPMREVERWYKRFKASQRFGEGFYVYF